MHSPHWKAFGFGYVASIIVKTHNLCDEMKNEMKLDTFQTKLLTFQPKLDTVLGKPGAFEIKRNIFQIIASVFQIKPDTLREC